MPNPVPQRLLQLALRQTLQAGGDLPGVAASGFKVYSQTDEDGILHYLFSVIGVTNKICVEACAGDGLECNTANLIINDGWTGLLMDGNAELVARGRAFYEQCPQTCIWPPQFACAWITRDNINDLFKEKGVPGEIDLLSLDLDGVDYWIWEAISVIQPRIVVVEYQDILGPDRSWTVPYASDFDAARHGADGVVNYFGASLRAFTNLGNSKGYRLVGTNRLGYNAFFIRNDLGQGVIPTVNIEDCFSHPKVQQGMRDRFPSVQNLPWDEV